MVAMVSESMTSRSPLGPLGCVSDSVYVPPGRRMSSWPAVPFAAPRASRNEQSASQAPSGAGSSNRVTVYVAACAGAATNAAAATIAAEANPARDVKLIDALPLHFFRDPIHPPPTSWSQPAATPDAP
jgi:hypothetical protein